MRNGKEMKGWEVRGKKAECEIAILKQYIEMRSSKKEE